MIVYKPVNNVKAMTFDLDDTLYDNWPFIIEAERLLLDYLSNNYPSSSALTKQDWRDLKTQALRDDPSLWSDMGDLRRDTLTRGLRASGYQAEKLEKAVADCFDYFYFQRSNFEVSAQICAILSDLSESMPLVAITNGNVNLEQIGIAQYFTHTYKANRTQTMKPSPIMFDLAAKKLALPREQILHVGDNAEKDVWGAFNAGFLSAWYACNRPMDIRSENMKVLPNIHLASLSELRYLL